MADNFVKLTQSLLWPCSLQFHILPAAVCFNDDERVHKGSLSHGQGRNVLHKAVSVALGGDVSTVSKQ